MDQTFWEAVAAVAAGVAVLGSGVSWWQANGSRRARRAAEEARDRAERQVVAAESLADSARAQAESAAEKVEQLRGLLVQAEAQSESLREIAAASTGPDLSITWDRGVLFRLRNNTAEPIVIERVENREMFIALRDLEDGTEIPGHTSVTFTAFGASGRPLPPQVVLKASGEDESRSVEIPVRPHK